MINLSTILVISGNITATYEEAIHSFETRHFLNPIHWCQNGQDALDFLDKKGAYALDDTVQCPDLILLDFSKPSIDGRHVLEKIKADSNLRSVPVVIFTGAADHNDMEESCGVAVSAYVQKPISFDGLMEAVQAMKDNQFGVAVLPNQKSIRKVS